MKLAMTESDLIKMENNKMPLPVGMSRTNYGSYRVQRKINGKAYCFPNVRDIGLAINLNEKVREMAADFEKELDKPNCSDAYKLILQQNKELKDELVETKRNTQVLYKAVSELIEGNNKSFFKRLFKL